MPTPKETKPLLEQLIDIVEKVNNEDLDTNEKLLGWFERKFQEKVNEKIFGDIALTQVALFTNVEDVKKVLENILSLYTKLCDPTLFTQETKHRILSLERNLNISGTQLPQNPAQSEKHFHALLQSHSQFAMLIEEEANIRTKLTNIQASLMPHMEILHKELGYA